MARRYAYARDEIADRSDEECRELLTALLEEVRGTVDSIRGRMGRDQAAVWSRLAQWSRPEQ